MSCRRATAGAAALALMLVAVPAAAEERTVEALGVAGVEGAGRVSAARARAVSAGIAEAVYQVVAEELPALGHEKARSVAQRLVGGKARDYVTRFRVIEDRGIQPREILRNTRTSHEYVVRVEASVDASQVRDRLIRAGLRAPAGEGALRHVELTLEALPSYAAYAQVREALVDQLQAETALPLEFTGGRAVLDVVTREDGRGLLDRLAAARLTGIRIEPLAAEAHRARAAVRAN